ncbi:MAG: UvrD-helicase domain-containing protein [Desulfarculus sp.]|nr:UvrD-helicase domain-containing protein [Desulfarculus sp.]
MIVADLHIHSRYSRATARDLTPESLWQAAQIKGVDLLGAGDCTHPAWLAELRERLVETSDGAYELRPELTTGPAQAVPGACRRPVRFLLSGEISCVYQRHGSTRKVHLVVILPDFAAAEAVNLRLGRLGNITSDGRPILGLDARDLVELVLDCSPRAICIPAHIWTPWFSLFGSKSGFDRIEDCFADLTGQIHALETGLSSDPAMNWRLSALDGYTLVSNSDAHSPANLAREANLLDCPPTFPALAAALADPWEKGFVGTLEFFPDEGKYHLDGHRKCDVRLEPAETRRLGGRCPVCGGRLTVGVLSRVEDLADRPVGGGPARRPKFEYLVPLGEVLGEVLQKGPRTKGVLQAQAELIRRLGPELQVLRQASLEDLNRVGGPVLAEAVRRMRAGKVWLEGGYDGQFGVVRLFAPEERKELAGQGRLWRGGEQPRPQPVREKTNPAFQLRPAAEPSLPLADPAVAAAGLNPEQRAAAEFSGGPLIVRAGPGSGKTRLLVARAAQRLAAGADPARVQLVTFTRKAAGELAQRLADACPAGGAARVGTFHSLGREVLAQALGGPPQVIDEEERLALVAELAKKAGLKAGELGLRLTLAKQRVEDPPEPWLRPWFRAYQETLAQRRVVDLDDLVRQAVLCLRQNPDLARTWRERFQHLLVDEYQDVNPAQVEFLRALAGPQCQVAVIGDPDQAIYGFRGADRRLFAAFVRDFPGAVGMSLRENYRNRAPILALAQALIAVELDPGRPEQVARAGDGPLPVLTTHPSPEAEADWVARQVVELLGGVDSRQVEAGADQGHDYAAREIAVLYRLHAQAAPLAEALARAGVPHQVAAQEPLAETDPLDFKAQRVNLLSMHAAKGLEFPVVFVTGLEDGLVPYLPPERAPSDPAEERRLLYVALTRARERLYLSRATRRSLYGQARTPGLSPLLAGLPPGLWQEPMAPRRPRKPRQMGLF